MTARSGDAPFANVCVVGLGNHARTKLIPALVANGQTIAGLVSSRAYNEWPDVPVFATIAAALDTLPPDTVFVIATPPALHFAQVMAALAAGRAVIVEKPAFVTAPEAEQAVALAATNGVMLVEAFMHRHTGLHARFMEFWTRGRASIEAIDITFVVPQMPDGTFRQNGSIESSALYDIGSYVLALLTDLDVPLDCVNLSHVDEPGDDRREAMRLSSDAGPLRIDALIGIGETYINRVTVRSAGTTTAFAPFFYGRPGDRTITTSAAGSSAAEVVADSNAFERMFAVPRDTWRADQSERSARIVDVTRTLQRLGADLADRRRIARPTIPRSAFDADKTLAEQANPAKTPG